MFYVALKLRLVDLNYNSKYDWLIELSNNNLACELVGNINHNREICKFFCHGYYLKHMKNKKKNVSTKTKGEKADNNYNRENNNRRKANQR